MAAIDPARLGPLADPAQFHDPVDLRGTPPELALAALEQMILIRAMEERIGDGVTAGTIRCPCHLAIGQEAVAVGMAQHVRAGDRVFGAHRSHAHFLALGGSPQQLMDEVLGRDTGCSRGMGGSMHLRDVAHHFWGSVPIVAATIPIATGAALAAQMDGKHALAVSCFGDGATEEGVFHESLNLAATMKLPAIFLCENNLFSSHLHISLRQPADSTCRYAVAHCVPFERVDGNDIVAVGQAMQHAAAHARAGNGPFYIEAVTYRWRGHVGPREDVDVGVLRKDNLALWKKRDPIARLAATLMKTGHLSISALDAMWQRVRAATTAVWERALTAPHPPEAALKGRVFSNA
ncbi:MAG: thiamine pyrophosphate-dependent dehydrogenase E1 component subunit alpha [Pedosphaera sp.]|nr:thiamine pyrophosphate-dependent dehydrogenase E1 component subunit alpha [Pedosphaera sp.]